MTPTDYKYKIAQLKSQIKELQREKHRSEGVSYARGYNEATREFTNRLRMLAGVDPL